EDTKRRGGPSVAAHIPGLFDDVSPNAAPAGTGGRGAAVSIRTQGCFPARPRTLRERGDCRTHAAPERLADLLLRHRGQRRPRSAGWLAAAQAARAAVATVETSVHSGLQSDATWDDGGACLDFGDQRAWLVVERWRLTHEPKLPEILL